MIVITLAQWIGLYTLMTLVTFLTIVFLTRTITVFELILGSVFWFVFWIFLIIGSIIKTVRRVLNW